MSNQFIPPSPNPRRKVRRPRVRIEYDSHSHDGSRRVELPFVIGVLADLTGKLGGSDETPADPNMTRGLLAKGGFIEFQKYNFNEQMKVIRPRLRFHVPNVLSGSGTLAVDLVFEAIKDFAPQRVAHSVEPLHALLEAGARGAVTASPAPGEGPAAGQGGAAVAETDRLFSAQLSLILHHPDFLELEATWRALMLLVFGAETDHTLKIKVLNLSKVELRAACADGDDQALLKKLYHEEICQLGGQPFAVLLGGYEFNEPGDVKILASLARIASTAQAPFIAGATPGLFNLNSWQEVGRRGPQSLEIDLDDPDRKEWTALLGSAEAKYLYLTLPRFLTRVPYGKENPVKEFSFIEDLGSPPGKDLPWANSAYALGANIARSFADTGWFAMIRGADNGSVDGLVVSSYKTSQGERLIGPTEFLLPLRLDSELAESGFVPLCAYKNDCRAVFFSVGSLQRSEPSPGSRRADDTGFPVTLPQLLACCRFAHYLMCIFRERPRYFTARADLRMFLTNWINQYISVGDGLSQETLISKPLADARLEVVEQPDQPGCYKLDLQIRPRYQLVGTPALRLDVALPPRNALADLL